MSRTPPSQRPLTGLVPEVAARLLDRISRGDHPVGHRLTEQSLAEALGVSRSPVRKALQQLEALGAVRSEPNRGFFVALEGPRLRKLKLPQATTSDEAVYMKLAEDRLTEKVAAQITESGLMERYGLTRLQVQRVLNRMAREGIAERKPGRGWEFRPLLRTVEAHRESYRFRMVLEPAALLEPTFRIDKTAFERVRREQMQMLDGGIETWTPGERFRVGAEFHETLVACAGNRFMLDALRNVNRLRRVIEYHQQTNTAEVKARLQRQCLEHVHLLDLLEAGERMEASYTLRQHLDVVSAIKTGLPPDRKKTPRSVDASEGLIEVHL